EDVVMATLQYPSGGLAHVHVSGIEPHRVRKLSVVGRTRMAVFDDTAADNKLVIYDRGGEPPEVVSYGLSGRTGDIRIPALAMAEPLAIECRAFVEAIETRQWP